MTVIYQNDFTVENLTPFVAEGVSCTVGWSSKDQLMDVTCGVPGDNGVLYNGDLGAVGTIDFDVQCYNLPTFQYQTSDLAWHTIALTTPCVSELPGAHQSVNINQTIKGFKILNSVDTAHTYDNFLILSQESQETSAGFTPTQGAAVVTGIGSSLADVMLPVLPIVFGFVLVSFVVVWAFNRLVAFFRRS